MLTEDKKEFIAIQVIRTLKKQFNKFPDEFSENRNAPFHEAFLNAFATRLEGKVESQSVLINLSSWMHGLNTSLGQSFFENIARNLCDGEKKTFKHKEIFILQSTVISEIMTDLKNSDQSPDTARENELLDSFSHGRKKNASDFTVDCFYIDENNVIAIELKSVRPNSGEMRGEKQKILNAKAVLKHLYPTKVVKYYFGFPFDPLSENSTGYNKVLFLDHLVEGKKFCAADEILLSDELWSFLSGDNNTMQQILDIINAIATPNFLEEYEFLTAPNSIKLDKYKEIVGRWFLYRELKIAENIEILNERAKSVVKTSKYINQSLFDNDCLYNENRSLNLIPFCLN